MRRRIVPCIAVVACFAARAALAQGSYGPPPQTESSSHASGDHAEYGSQNGGDKLYDAIADAIEDYVKEDAKLKGGEFLVYDGVEKKVLQLDLEKVHTDRLAPLEDGEYYACADMKDAGGTAYDIDFFVRPQKDAPFQITRIAIHKKGDQSRYSWKQERGAWKQVKS